MRTHLEHRIERHLAKAPHRLLEQYVRHLAPKQKLLPSPGWSFDLADRRDDLGTFARRFIWGATATRIERPVEVKWCGRLRLRLRLGNDVSWWLFVGGMYEPNELSFMASTLTDGMTVSTSAPTKDSSHSSQHPASEGTVAYSHSNRAGASSSCCAPTSN